MKCWSRDDLKGIGVAKGSSGLGLWLLVGTVVLIAVIPREVWVGLGVVAALAAAIYVFVKWRDQRNRTAHSRVVNDEPTLAELTARSRLPPPSTSKQAFTKTDSQSEKSGQSSVPPRDSKSGSSPLPSPSRPAIHVATVIDRFAKPTPVHSLPKPPPGYGTARWIRPDEVIEVASSSVPGGLFYFGNQLAAPNGTTDPCLISPRHNVARQGDFTQRQTNYWPSYSEISAAARRAYINWLAGGRSHPDCDIGLVFLFFYGLERRAVLDASHDSAAIRDLPGIADEIRRLLEIYGGKSASFRNYASALLDWIEISEPDSKLYMRPVPEFRRSYELPGYLRLALGQAALDRAPVPAELALAWVRLNPNVFLRTAAIRCPDEFDRLFVELYGKSLGAGLALPKNRTKLKLFYRPASAALPGSSCLTKSFGDVPDVTALTAPLRTLQEIVDACTDALSSFSRAVGKEPAARTNLDGLLLLPASLWPVDFRLKLESLILRMKDGMSTIPFGSVISTLGGAGMSLSRDKVRALVRTLEGAQVGMEPNVLAGAKMPSSTDPVVLFSMPAGENQYTDSPSFRAAILTLQLSAAVAVADGEFHAREVAHLRKEIENWSHLTPAHQRRLHAHLQWLIAAPVTLTSLKRKIEPLELRARETVAAFMATLVQSDGAVSPQEVKFLEKVYKALGVEPKRVFTDLHAVTTHGTAPNRQDSPGFRLDPKRVAQLEQDTERVTALLANIFKEEDSAPAPTAADEPDEEIAESTLLGLDNAHAALARLMLSRPQWGRAELEDAAADLELMLDGALEQINEASFDAHGLPLSEGEDPVDINPDLLEKMQA